MQLYKRQCGALLDALDQVASEDRVADADLLHGRGPAAVQAALLFLQALPTPVMIPVGSQVLPAAVIAQLDTAIKQELAAAATVNGGVAKSMVFSNVTPSLVFLLDGSVAAGLAADPNAVYELGDRVRLVRSVGKAAVGAFGVVTGLTGTAGDCEVVLDNAFVGGSSLNGRCGDGRGATLPRTALVNLSFGLRRAPTMSPGLSSGSSSSSGGSGSGSSVAASIAAVKEADAAKAVQAVAAAAASTDGKAEGKALLTMLIGGLDGKGTESAASNVEKKTLNLKDPVVAEAASKKQGSLQQTPVGTPPVPSKQQQQQTDPVAQVTQVKAAPVASAAAAVASATAVSAAEPDPAKWASVPPPPEDDDDDNIVDDVDDDGSGSKGSNTNLGKKTSVRAGATATSSSPNIWVAPVPPVTPTPPTANAFAVAEDFGHHDEYAQMWRDISQSKLAAMTKPAAASVPAAGKGAPVPQAAKKVSVVVALPAAPPAATASAAASAAVNAAASAKPKTDKPKPSLRFYVAV